MDWYPLMRRQLPESRWMRLNTKYVAELPVRNRFAASVGNRTEAKIDAIGLVVRKLFQLLDGKR